MKILWIFLTWAACAIGVQAQTASTTKQPATAIADGPEAERARINADRTRLEAGFAAEDTACYRKFLVNKCLDEIKPRRREALADLKRQEISLDAQDRMAKAAEQIQKAEAKTSPETRQQEAARRDNALKDFEARLEREKQKTADRLATQSGDKANRVKGSQDKTADRAAKQAAAAQEVKKFKERQQKAKERQAQHERNQAAAPAKALPLPE